MRVRVASVAEALPSFSWTVASWSSEQRARVGGEFIYGIGEIAFGGEQVAASGFVAVLNEQVARLRGELLEFADAGFR